jgi:type VI protein secretion system component VasF
LAAAEEPDVPEPPENSAEQASQTMQPVPQVQHHNLKKWKLMTLARLFRKSQKESLRVRTACRAMEEAETYMRVMAELDALNEDGIVDDGVIEILDDEAYTVLR